MFKWLGTGLSTVATVLVVYMVISGASFLFFPGGALTLTAFVPLLVTIFWTAGVTCKGQMYRHMVRALQPPELRWRADIASLLIPALGIVGIGVVGFLTLSVLRLIQNPGSVNPISASQLVQGLIGGAFLPPGLALIGYVLFLTVYLRTSDRLSQGLSQVHASMPVMPMWPGYPPQPGQAPPTAPPPPAASSPAPAPTAGGTCPQCGQSVTPEAVFCMNCGARTKA